MATLPAPLRPEGARLWAPGRDDIGKGRALALLGLLLRRAKIDETGDPLVIGKRQGLAHALAVAAPFGDPLHPEPERRGGNEEVLAGGGRREELSPFPRRPC